MTLKNKTLKTAEEFLADEEVRNILFNEVPPMPHIVVYYLKHVKDDIYSIDKSNPLLLVRNVRINQATGEKEYFYMANPSDVEKKITRFIEQFDHVEWISIEQNLFSEDGLRY